MMQDGKHNVSVDQSLAELFDQGNSRQSSPVCLPPMVNQETLLDELSSSVLDNRYIIVTDDSHRIVGVVLSEEIRQKFATPNKRERDRWAGMALSFLISVTFPAAAEISTHNVLAVRQNDSTRRLSDTAYIATEHDLFLSWERISSILAGAMSDPLTGLPNRMAFDRRLNEEWNRSERTGCSIGAILLDLDHFKQINDTLGHAAGDAVLQDVATRFEDSLRSYDLVVRYGGDEFIALCLGCEPAEIEIPIRRIMDSLRNSTVLIDYGREGIEASIGAAVQHFDFVGFKPKDLFARADECLYRAKSADGCAVYIDFFDGPSTHRTIEAGDQTTLSSLRSESFGGSRFGATL
jgi:diguanylate cyclase (GGDEF)-like protein